MNKNLLLVELLISLVGFLIGAQNNVDNKINIIKWKDDNKFGYLQSVYNVVYYLSSILAAIFIIVLGNKYSRKGLITVFLYILLCGVAMEFAVNLFLKNIYIGSATYFVVNFATTCINIHIPIYIAEVSQAKNRGAFLCFYLLMNALGNSYTEYFSNILMKYSYLSTLIPGIIIAFLLRYIPNTPRWLCLKDKENEATEVLSKLNNTFYSDVNIKNEIRTIQKDVLSGHSISYLRILVIYFLALFQELIGNQYLGLLRHQYELKNMFQSKDSKTSGINYSKMLLVERIINHLSLLFIIFIIDRIGRKRLLSAGSFILFAVIDIVKFQDNTNIAIITLLLITLFIYYCSWGSVSYIYAVEIFPIHCRVKGYALYMLFVYINSIISSYISPIILSKGTIGLFIFSGMCFITSIFVEGTVTETKRVALEEIEEKISSEKDNDKPENQV